MKSILFQWKSRQPLTSGTKRKREKIISPTFCWTFLDVFNVRMYAADPLLIKVSPDTQNMGSFKPYRCRQLNCIIFRHSRVVLNMRIGRFNGIKNSDLKTCLQTSPTMGSPVRICEFHLHINFIWTPSSSSNLYAFQVHHPACASCRVCGLLISGSRLSLWHSSWRRDS